MDFPALLVASGDIVLPPIWSVIPFVLILLGIAILPLFAHHWWESNRNRAVFSWIIAVPTAIWWISNYGWGGMVHEWKEYVSFILLLGSLYIASGGIFLRGDLRTGAGTNTAICAIGAVIANIVGTTGASMLLIRPFMKANAHRPMKSRVLTIIFFIFTVSNMGGLLTPLGDPPLFLGFLKGVPFFWTTTALWKQWIVGVGIVLAVFFVWDRARFAKEDGPPPEETKAGATGERFGIEGWVNVALLGCIMGAVLGKGSFKWPFGIQEAIMAAVAVASMALTKKELRKKNRFTFGPINEVAILFSGIFTVMVPVLAILEVKGGDLGLTKSWQYFWVTGGLSGFLDNAPTYVVFAKTGAAQATLDAGHTVKIGGLIHEAPHLLAAISVGAVFMGAMSYIGNGPNFMVKAIAEESGIKMPSFFGYMKYSALILIPIFLVITAVFFLSG